jgi:hypothetical protein
MTLALAIQAIADEYGLGAKDCETLLSAATRGSKSREQWMRLARLAENNYHGKALINFDRGMITDTRIDTSLDALDRFMNGFKDGEG